MAKIIRKKIFLLIIRESDSLTHNHKVIHQMTVCHLFFNIKLIRLKF